jgi:hypothetical protein
MADPGLVAGGWWLVAGGWWQGRQTRPEVRGRARRRTFTAKYKAKVLAAYADLVGGHRSPADH